MKKEYTIDELLQKPYWTLKQAALVTSIGINKLREISNREDCDLVLWVGGKRLLKKDKLLDYLNSEFSI